MKLILLSGGSGKRLWPLSNDSRSKQFLKVLQGEPGQLESMVQRVWRQLGRADLQQSALIATSKAQAEVIRNQLGMDVPLVIEPERRDTFPAIVLASSYVFSHQRADLDEVVVILPVDPYVDDSYFTRIKDLERVLNHSGASLALMGVEPIHASEKYGYIVPKHDGNTNQEEYFWVSHFREKPDQRTANELIRQGALWNCGVFAFSLRYLQRVVEEKGLPFDYDRLILRYRDLPKISFDYEVVEQTDRSVVLPYRGSWKDLGTWNALTEEMSAPVIGKGVISGDSVNAHIVNELDIPVVLLGVSDVVVAASPDGILVTDKASSPRIKDFVVDVNQRPMYEERRWGWYKVLDYAKYSQGMEVMTRKVCIHENKNLSYHFHQDRSETWTILKGEGQFVLEGEFRHVEKHDVLHIPAGARHAIRADEELEFIEVQQGMDLSENDIHRIYMTWFEICSAFGKHDFYHNLGEQ
jgi:Mannose-1-phosphate guanylyltransferase